MGKALRTGAVTIVAATVLFSVSGCGLGGQWTGEWQNGTTNQVSGTFDLTWTEQGSDLAGIISVSGTPCLSTGQVSGLRKGDEIYFGVVSGEVNVEFTGAVNEDGSMSGTYSTTCGNAQGTWSAHKQ